MTVKNWFIKLSSLVIAIIVFQLSMLPFVLMARAFNFQKVLGAITILVGVGLAGFLGYVSWKKVSQYLQKELNQS